MGKRKKIDPKYAVKDDSIKVERFPIHNNETPMVQSISEDGKVEFHPADPFCSVRIKGYFDDGSGYSGYEVMARMYEKDGLFQWVRGKKWDLVGYIKPYTFQVQWLKRSQWLSDQVGVLVKDIQDYESVMKERIRNGIV